MKLKLDIHGEGEIKGIAGGTPQIAFLDKLKAEVVHSRRRRARRHHNWIFLDCVFEQTASRGWTYTVKAHPKASQLDLPRLCVCANCKLMLDIQGEGKTKDIATGSPQIVFLSKV